MFELMIVIRLLLKLANEQDAVNLNNPFTW